MASLDPSAQLLPLPAPQLIPLPAPEAAQGPTNDGADALMVTAAPPQPVRSDQPEDDSPAMGRPAPHPGAMLRSRSNGERQAAAGRRGAPASQVRRALPLAFAAAAEPADLAMQLAVLGAANALAPQAPVAQGALVARGRAEPERAILVQQREANRRHEVHIDVLRSELNAARQLSTASGGGRLACATQSQPLVWRWSECERAKSQPLKAWRPRWLPFLACSGQRRAELRAARWPRWSRRRWRATLTRTQNDSQHKEV